MPPKYVHFPWVPESSRKHTNYDHHSNGDSVSPLNLSPRFKLSNKNRYHPSSARSIPAQPAQLGQTHSPLGPTQFTQSGPAHKSPPQPTQTHPGHPVRHSPVHAQTCKTRRLDAAIADSALTSVCIDYSHGLRSLPGQHPEAQRAATE